MPAPLKITPSMLTFLWDDCRRCFWLHAHGLHQPRMPFPSVFSRYHDALTRYGLGRCPSVLSPSLPPGRFVGGELWVKSRPLTIGSERGALFILGRLDHLAHFDDGTWGVIDFKTTAPSDTSAARYTRQLHAYAWALERAAPDALCRAPVTRLGLYCLDPVDVTLTDDGHVAARLQASWIDIERDDDGFADFLAEVLAVLRRPLPPPAAPGCSCCRYTERRRAMARAAASVHVN
ncbi:MAG: PD-(D/E)XK nuclease family protein [Bacteroidota bacterium]